MSELNKAKDTTILNMHQERAHTHTKKDQENVEQYWFESHFLCNLYVVFLQGWEWICSGFDSSGQ